jgi:PKD repeat protein
VKKICVSNTNLRFIALSNLTEEGEEEVPVSRVKVHAAVIIPLLLVAPAFLISPASAGNTLTARGVIPPGPGPVADFSAYPVSGPVPLVVQFTDTSMGSITGWSWDYRPNGGPWIPFGAVKDPAFTFRTSGTYDIRLTVTGPMGSDEEIKPAYITASEPARRPVARFTQDRFAGQAPLTVRFTDRSLNEPTSYLWHFGDGSTSDRKNPSHTFSRPGIYLVRLRVSNSAGSDTAASLVVVLHGWWR